MINLQADNNNVVAVIVSLPGEGGDGICVVKDNS